jgi:hypothetical protein
MSSKENLFFYLSGYLDTSASQLSHRPAFQQQKGKKLMKPAIYTSSSIVIVLTINV